MRRAATITTLLATAAAGGALGVGAAGASGKTKPKTTKTVKVQDDYYNPAAMKITAGTKVKWVWAKMNYDSHNVTLLKGPAGISAKTWSSRTAASGITFARTFLKPGTYHFYCTIHPTSMNLTIVVKK